MLDAAADKRILQAWLPAAALLQVRATDVLKALLQLLLPGNQALQAQHGVAGGVACNTST
jgi:hypothetical protein